MEFLIKSIEPKPGTPQNAGLHSAAEGRECDIIHLVVGESGRLRIDLEYDPGNPHRVCTSWVLKIENPDDDTIVFETENSVYTLIPNEKGNGNENV